VGFNPPRYARWEVSCSRLKPVSKRVVSYVGECPAVNASTAIGMAADKIKAAFK